METLIKLISSIMLLWLLQDSVNTYFTSVPRSQVNGKNNIILNIANTSSDLSNSRSTTVSHRDVSITSPQDRVRLESPVVLKSFNSRTFFISHTVPLPQLEPSPRTGAPSVVLQGLLVRVPPKLVTKKVLEKTKKTPM